ncbi:hypothetical protein K4K61_005078 [Colletotrichum sp. SAR11_59]|nr:hypothetical protein K4K61_005078 [Colletotrichum sp. SAR11_59]
MDVILPLLESIIEFTVTAIAVISLIVTIGGVWAKVVEAFVSNSDNFIRRGRKIQNHLHLPQRLCLFADSDPGMSEDTVRFIGAAALPVGLMLVAIIVWGISLGARHEEPDEWFWYLVGLFVGALVFMTTLLICAELIDTFTETSCPSIPCHQRAQNLHRLLASLRVFPDSNLGIGDRALRFITDAALPQGIALLALSARATYLAARHEVPSRWFCYLLGILTGGW